MISIRFYLNAKESKKGMRSLYMDVHCDGAARLRQAIGETVKAKDWNAKREELKASHPYHREINARLERISLKVQNSFREMMDQGETPTGPHLRGILRPVREQHLAKTVAGKTVSELMLDFASRYREKQSLGGKKTGDSYARKFTQVAGHLETFRPGMLPGEINQKSWDEYLAYLYEEAKVQDGTVGKHLQAWKVALREAGLPHEHDWLKNTFNREKIMPDLAWAEVKKLATFEYEDQQLREVAHAFVIDCHLALRWGDLSTLTENHLLEVKSKTYGTVHCFRKRQGKTGQPVLVPLPPLAQELFSQYKIIPIPRAIKTGTPNLTEYNKRLKKAAKAAGLNRAVTVETIKNRHVVEEHKPLHSVISSHTARHTAASRIREAADIETAQLVLGHAVEGNIGRYAHLDPVKTVERILKVWEYYG